MEIIKRTSEVEKETVSSGEYNERMQISFNNFGHIALRFFDKNFKPQPTKLVSVCKHCDKSIHTISDNVWYHDDTGDVYCDLQNDKVKAIVCAEPNEEIPLTKPQDTLIVLSATESQDLIEFIKQRLM